ncbi:MAG: PTS transporter subunit IIC [Mediterraneibacter gnavus]
MKPCQEVTDGAGFCLAHQQMFGVAFFYWLAGKLFGNENKKNKGKKVKESKISSFQDSCLCSMTIWFPRLF